MHTLRWLLAALVCSPLVLASCDDQTQPQTVGGADARQPDASGRDAAVAGECPTADARRCGADGVEVCSANQWVPVGPCVEGVLRPGHERLAQAVRRLSGHMRALHLAT